MGFIEKVTAAPQNVDWVGYKPKQMNIEMYRKLASDKRKKHLDSLTKDIHLYAFPDKFAVLDEKKHEVLYLVQFKIAVFFGRKSISQIQVWRNMGNPLTEGLAKKIFFDFLFPKAECVVTDKQQTSYGRTFWELRIADAIARNLPVYLCDQNTRTKKRLNSYDDFTDLADGWWGDDPKFQAKKIAICHSEFWG